MEGVGGRSADFQACASVNRRHFQKHVDPRLKETDKQHYSEKLKRNGNTIQNASPLLNGATKSNQRNSGSDGRHNYPSSSSQEVDESPDSQRANQRSVGHQFNHHHFFVGESSPQQLDNSGTQNLNSAELNANLMIDPKEITAPINQVQESPVKPNDRFYLAMNEKMFKAVKKKDSSWEEGVLYVFGICKNILNMPPEQFPDFVKHYRDQIAKNSSDHTRSVNGKTEKNKDSTHTPSTLHSSHNMPSTSQLGVRESSSSWPKSKGDTTRKHVEAVHSVVKAKELKEHLPSHDGKNLPSTSQQGAEESSRSCSGPKHDVKRKLFMPAVDKLEQSFQDKKKLYSLSQLRGAESTRTCPSSKQDKKRKFLESSQSVVKTKELKEKQQISQDGKLKHMPRTEYVANCKESKEEKQPFQSRILKCKEAAQRVAKGHEFKDEYQMPQDSKSKLDPKRVCAMALEARNCDKNHIKKRESPDQSALLAITSSKKERTSLYHGGRKCEVSRLKDMCVQFLNKLIKQNSDPTKIINRNVSFEILEPILVLVSPDKLQKLEDKMTYLKKHTNGIWEFFCEKQFKSQLDLNKRTDNWRAFYERCCVESEEKLRNITASISASASKARPDRQIKFTTVDGPPTKRPKIDVSTIAKNIANNAVIKPLQNSSQPSNSRSHAPVPPKGLSNHIKSSCKPIKKDAPLMHKAKKTLGQLHRIHRN